VVPAALPLVQKAKHSPKNRIRKKHNEKEYFDDRAARSCHAAFGASGKQTRTGEDSANVVPAALPLS
jgi:hypothetical protein